jgi:4'-phosphopantetheinyl transferase
VTGRAQLFPVMPSDTDVWIVDLAASGAQLVALERARSLLTDPERARAQRIVDTRHRERWIATYTALHLALMARIGRPVAFSHPGGTAKPRVAGWDGDFSLSHSGALALIAIRAQGSIGIDAEVRRPVRLGTARRQLIEVAGAAALPDVPLPQDDAEMRFLAAWTRLEAIGKMRATGIGALLETLGIIAQSPGTAVVAERTSQLVTNDARPIGLAVIDVERFDGVAALASSPPGGPPRMHDFASALAHLSR